MSHPILTTSTKKKGLLQRRKEAERRKPTMQEASPNPFDLLWVMTRLLKKPLISARIACKTFAGTGPSDGTSTKAFLTGSGRCNLPSVHPFNILRPCAVSTLKKIVIYITQYHRSFPTPIHSKLLMITLKRKRD